MQAMAGPTIPEEFLKAENVGLRMLLEQAGIDARTLLAQAGIDAVFADVAELASHCKFGDCSHNGEPGCAVREAAIVDPSILDRLASVRKLEREQRYQNLQVDERLRAEARRDHRRWAKAVRSQPHR